MPLSPSEYSDLGLDSNTLTVRQEVTLLHQPKTLIYPLPFSGCFTLNLRALGPSISIGCTQAPPLPAFMMKGTPDLKDPRASLLCSDTAQHGSTKITQVSFRDHPVFSVAKVDQRWGAMVDQ